MKKFFGNNGLSMVFLLLFAVSFCGQVACGLKEYNKQKIEDHQPAVTLGDYFQSGHFMQSTFENWESEFL